MAEAPERAEMRQSACSLPKKGKKAERQTMNGQAGAEARALVAACVDRRPDAPTLAGEAPLQGAPHPRRGSDGTLALAAIELDNRLCVIATSRKKTEIEIMNRLMDRRLEINSSLT